MTVATVGSVEIREMVAASRLRSAPLKVKTNSGSVYHLYPLKDRKWNVYRAGVDGSKSFHAEVGVFLRGTDLQIGPWLTTGLKDIYVL